LNDWVDVEIQQAGDALSLTVNDDVVSLPGSSGSMPAFERIYIGGYSNYSEIQFTSFTDGFEGCVSEIRVKMH
jgi:hypothetical protein